RRALPSFPTRRSSDLEVRASQFSGSGLENALRTEFRQLAMNPKRLRRFTQEEQRAIKEVAFGNPTSNTLRQIGKLAPTGGLMQRSEEHTSELQSRENL